MRIPDKHFPKLLSYKKVGLVMEREDAEKRRIPFDCVYMAKNGRLVECENVVCIKYDIKHHRHTVQFPDSGVVRTLRDVLLLSVNEFKIVVN